MTITTIGKINITNARVTASREAGIITTTSPTAKTTPSIQATTVRIL